MLAALRVAPVPATPLLTGCGRYDLSEWQGRDEEQGFSGPNKEQGEEKAAARAGPYATQSPDGMAARKRHARGSMEQRRRVAGWLWCCFLSNSRSRCRCKLT